MITPSKPQSVLIKASRTIFLFIFLGLGVALIGWETTNLLAVDKPKNNYVLADTQISTLEPIIGSSKSVSLSGSGEQSVVEGDARPLLIKHYLEKYNSPLLPYVNVILETAASNNFDYRWIVAIAQQESNLCKKMPENSFNCWGYGITSTNTLRFEDYETAIRSYGNYLKTEYFDKGLTTPATMMKKYCPPSDGSWARGVQQFLDEIESGN